MRDINDIMSLKNQSIVEDLVKDKQERIDKDSHKIMEEFPVEAPKVVPTEKTKQDKPYSTKLNTSSTKLNTPKKKFSFFKKKRKAPTEQEVPEPKEPRKFEQPIMGPPSIPQKIPKTKKKGDFNKLIIPLILVIAIFAVAFVWTFKCDCPTETTSCVDAKVEATGTLINSIQNQIIINGYAEIFDGNMLIKLAPYTG